MAAVHAGAVADRERGDDEIALADGPDVGADLLDEADELVADALRAGDRRDAAVGPQVRPADAGRPVRTIASVGRRIDGSSTFSTRMSRSPCRTVASI
jgi:hypothetical protein